MTCMMVPSRMLVRLPIGWFTSPQDHAFIQTLPFADHDIADDLATPSTRGRRDFRRMVPENLSI